MHNKSPVLIFVVGVSGSGKTTAIEYLTKHLTGVGLQVGVVKHIHEKGLNLDTRGKDTWRHAEAGANIIVGVASREVLLYKKTTSETELPQILSSLRSEPIDVLFLEGYSMNSPKNSYRIVTANSSADLKPTLRMSSLPILAITGRIARSSNSKLETLALTSRGFELTGIVRQLVHPKELRDSLRNASRVHGGSCVGVAVGLRASYLVSNILGELSSARAVFGTKRCIADGFTFRHPRLTAKTKNRRDDSIFVRKGRLEVLLRLTPKGAFRNVMQVLDAPDAKLFRSVRIIQRK
jgi:molybdopterin-guanine dinucleotide biosynthesis protein B